MTDNKSSRKGPAPKGSAQPVEIRLEYHFIETVPPHEAGTGPYVETFDFEDEQGGHARLFGTAKGQRELTWRCHYPFVLIFQGDEACWNKYFAPKHGAGHPYLYREIDGEFVLAAVRSTRDHKSHYYKHHLKLRIKRHFPVPKAPFYYTIVPKLVLKPKPKRNRMVTYSSGGGRGGINLSQ